MIASSPTNWLEATDSDAAGLPFHDCPCARLAAAQAKGAFSDRVVVECLEESDWPCPNAVPVGGTFVYFYPTPALC
jgi:hypothetical protein